MALRTLEKEFVVLMYCKVLKVVKFNDKPCERSIQIIVIYLDFCARPFFCKPNFTQI